MGVGHGADGSKMKPYGGMSEQIIEKGGITDRVGNRVFSESFSKFTETGEREPTSGSSAACRTLAINASGS